MKILNTFSEALNEVRLVEGAENFQHLASVGLILKIQNDELNILMIKRAINEKDIWSGHMAFPGGKKDNVDVDDKGTAIRETLEEIGLNLEECGKYIGRLNQLRVQKSGIQLDFAISPFVFFLSEDEDLKLDKSEVERVHWIPFEHINESKNLKEFDFVFGDKKVSLPAVEFEGEKIWGISYLILADLWNKFRGIALPSDEKICNQHWIEYPEFSKRHMK